jgi:hypothetical protein
MSQHIDFSDKREREQERLKRVKEKLPLTEDGGTLIEESDLNMDELSEIYIPNDEREEN